MIRTFLTLLTKDPRSGPIQGTWRGDFGEGGPSNGSSFTLLGDLGTSSYSVLCSSELHCTSEIALSATGEGIMSFTYLLHIQEAGKERKEYREIILIALSFIKLYTDREMSFILHMHVLYQWSTHATLKGFSGLLEQILFLILIMVSIIRCHQQ